MRIRRQVRHRPERRGRSGAVEPFRSLVDGRLGDHDQRAVVGHHQRLGVVRAVGIGVVPVVCRHRVFGRRRQRRLGDAVDGDVVALQGVVADVPDVEASTGPIAAWSGGQRLCVFRRHPGHADLGHQGPVRPDRDDLVGTGAVIDHEERPRRLRRSHYAAGLWCDSGGQLVHRTDLVATSCGTVWNGAADRRRRGRRRAARLSRGAGLRSRCAGCR